MDLTPQKRLTPNPNVTSRHQPRSPAGVAGTPGAGAVLWLCRICRINTWTWVFDHKIIPSLIRGVGLGPLILLFISFWIKFLSQLVSFGQHLLPTRNTKLHGGWSSSWWTIWITGTFPWWVRLGNQQLLYNCEQKDQWWFYFEKKNIHQHTTIN